LPWKINAAQAVQNHKQEQNNANEEVAMELETDQTVNVTQLSNTLEKCSTTNSEKKRINKKLFGQCQKPSIKGHKT